MKKGWQKQRLTSVTVKITDGSHNPPKGVAESDYLMLSSKNVFDDDLHYADPRYLTAEQYQLEDKRTGVVPDDVLLTIVGTIGRSAVVPSNAPQITLQRSVAVIRPNRQFIEPRFLMYSFIERCAELNEQARGVAQKGIYLESLRDLELMLPPLAEQQRIVGLLDKAFEGLATAIANAEKNLQNARALFESHLQSVFTQRGPGWVEKTIKEITSHLGDGLHGTPKYTVDGEYYFVNGNNLDDGKIVFKESTKRVSVTEYEKYKKNLTDRTVLVSINGTLGNVAFYNNEKIILGKSVCYFNVLESVDKCFIKYIISSPNFLQYAHREATGSTIKNVSLKSMRDFKVLLPSLTEQNTIVRKLDSLSRETQRLARLYEHKLAALEALKKSLLHQAFTGQLSDRASNDIGGITR